ncbi:MAG TPA: hypothetical protein VGC19_00410 [Rhodanobacter sp.]
MNLLHRYAAFVALALTLLTTGNVRATDVSMADGSVNFSTPDTWLGIMQTQGDPEVRVFQVPDTSPTGKNSLARVTVTVTQIADANGFQQYIGDATAQAMALPGYKIAHLQPEPNSNLYTAQENGTEFNYVEHYWMKNGHAIQLRCMRPMQSLAGAAWKAEFDKGCNAIAARLK